MQTLKKAILLIGHGSRDPIAVKEFIDFASEFQNKNIDTFGKEVIVTSAFLELSSPTIPQALRILAKDGINQITVIPYLLFSAGHVKTEIPEILEEFKKSFPEINILYGNSLWPHKNLIQCAKEKITQSLNKFPKNHSRDVDILVVGRGASDSQAIEQFKEAVNHISFEIPCRTLNHCFIALAQPKYSEALPALLSNSCKNLLIFPFYLFTGILVKRIEHQAEEAKKIFKECRIEIAPYFGSDPLMFQVLKEKVAETSNNLNNFLGALKDY
ncbi:MAG: sirohydrochlorin chelatase [Elusimicrobia bacterium]|nr:sirohydrochlorin chelatase [Elusimicrobiota bacterium]